jgi:5'-deoxynucleotidase YfbR-like HD superfamily hydrolase
MKTPEEFAARYMQREIYVPFMSNMSGLLYLPDIPLMHELEKIYKKSYKSKPKSLIRKRSHILDHKEISAATKGKLRIALHDLTEVMTIDITILKKLNKEFIKKRKDAIQYLEKVLEYPFIEKRQVIARELKRLKAFDKKRKAYKEIDFISSWQNIFYTGLLKKLVLKVETRKLSEMLSVPLDFSKGRPKRFFMKVLQIVVFRCLHEDENLSKEKAQCLTVEIINEYLGEIRFRTE